MATPALRRALVVLHRWTGLVLAGFLVLAGLTGALLVWVEELDAAVSPALFDAPAPSAAQPLDPLVLREIVQAAHPEAYVAMVPLHMQPGRALRFPLYPRPVSDPGQVRAPLPNDQAFVDPYTGRILGARKWGDLTQGLKNLVPFLYRLHFSLALDVVGSYVFGIVALVWTLDCFAGAWLTLAPPGGPRRGVLQGLMRWWPAWKVRWGAGTYKLNFDLHRAGGLWTWAVLFVLAWSGVAFNLSEVYEPVMKSFFTYQADRSSLPRAVRANVQPVIDWNGALATGRRLMAEQARQRGFVVKREGLLVHDVCCGPHGVYRYQVQSSRDIRDHWGSTQVIFDADTGELLQVWLPTGAAGGDTVRMWLTSLHMAALWGLPFRLFMTVMGFAVPVLAVTGVIIWARKRRGQRAHPRNRTETSP